MQENQKEVVKREAEVQEGIERTRSTKVYAPATDIIEKKDNMVLFADMPGVDEKSVEVTLEKNILTIYGKVEPRMPEKRKLVLSEYGIGDYHRTFTVSDAIDRDRIDATVSNGVLKLVLPKAEALKTKKIAVKAEN